MGLIMTTTHLFINSVRPIVAAAMAGILTMSLPQVSGNESTAPSSPDTLPFLAQAPGIKPLLPGEPGPRPELPQPRLAAPPPRPDIAPSVPQRPLDPSTIGTPRLPGATPQTLPCGIGGSPRSIQVTLTPVQVRSGTPVTIGVTLECPLKTGGWLDFTAATSNTDRGAQETMISFLNQIPDSWIQPDTTSTEIRFTPHGLTHTVDMEVKGFVADLSARSAPLALSIAGDGTVAPPASPPPLTTVGCTPTATLDAVEAAVINGATVTVNLGLSCSPPGGAVMQIITQPSSLLPGPPGGTVFFPDGHQHVQIQLQAAREGSGRVSLFAVMSQPAGGVSAPDVVLVNP
jgi:hypothetical protein